MIKIKRKTFVANTPEEIDKLCNEFESTHKIEFTQPSYFIHDRMQYFVVAMLYNETKPNYGDGNQARDIKIIPPPTQPTGDI